MLSSLVRKGLLKNAIKCSIQSNAKRAYPSSVLSIVNYNVPILKSAAQIQDWNNCTGNNERIDQYQKVRRKSALASFEHTEDSISLELHPIDNSLEKPSRYLISLLEDVHAGRDTGIECVTTERCNAAIAALLNCDSLESLQRAGIILDKMEDIGRTFGKKDHRGKLVATPDYFSYWSIMKAFIRLGDKSYTNKANELLRRMENAVEEGFCTASMTNIYDRFYRSLIFAKPSSTLESKDRAEMCEKAFMQMRRPDTKTFNYVLHLWAKCGRIDSSRKAEELFRTISELNSICEKFESCRPDIFSFNAVLDAYAERGEGRKAEELLKLMQELHTLGIEPDMISYISVFSAWCKHRGNATVAAERAIDTLYTMMDKFQNNKGKGQFKPQLYVMALKALGRCRDAESVAKAKNLLARMEIMGIQPNIFIYNAFLDVLAKSNIKSANMQAKEVIDRMNRQYKEKNDTVQPDLLSYTSYIKTIFANGPKNNIDEVLTIVQELEDNFDGGLSKIEPDTTLYSTLLCWCLKMDKDPYLTEKILIRMEDRFKKGHLKCRPSLYSYQSTMKSWLLSRDPIKGEKAYEIFLRCEKMCHTQKLNLLDYNLVLNCCSKVKKASHKQKSVSLGIAIEVFKKIQQNSNLKVSSQTYFLMLECCLNLIPNTQKRNEAVKTFFGSCKRDGLVSVNILHLLRRSCTTKFQMQLFGDISNKLNDLPLSWTINNEGSSRLES